ncbi:hypothetical protein GPECTOR_801g25 [Gonium pectorale]|uniref:Uncharacterized protein n=1 Tax=Gonium pectorale TaxID=33097 RepID=A0A150FVP5_GONPE|nr:hypothetical protein GPECTOR_801g25 [Gonium pectorale]|eukprot:KXZ41100.1 hypothetical protein GPECTOR_801g25 [Gonium pectorale]
MIKVMKASTYAACRCNQHNFPVLEEMFLAVRSSINTPDADVLSGRTRLYDVRDSVFKSVTKNIEKVKGSSPLEEFRQRNQGGSGSARVQKSLIR